MNILEGTDAGSASSDKVLFLSGRQCQLVLQISRDRFPDTLLVLNPIPSFMLSVHLLARFPVQIRYSALTSNPTTIVKNLEIQAETDQKQVVLQFREQQTVRDTVYKIHYYYNYPVLLQKEMFEIPCHAV